MNPETQNTVALIGLGAMGSGMAQSLLRAGFRVLGFDVSAAAREAFVGRGGVGAESAADAVRGASVCIVIVVNAEQAEAALFGAQGAASVLAAGSVVMLCSTVRPAFARETADRLRAQTVEMLDAPVSGGVARAAEGRLSVMASGSAAAFAGAERVLAALAENVFRLGDTCGQGSTVKMINQLLAGVHIAVSAEAMAFGVRAGVDPRMLYDVISKSAGSSWMFENRVPHMLEGDFTPRSAVDIFVKDLGIVLDTAREKRFPLPLAAAAHQLFLMAAAAGHGREDDAAVVKVFEQLAGIAVKER
ncbi:MAG: NAD-binding protein [Chloroflexi bacterium]|nr:NAD-binding protein [Chloroflexota bacterium]